MTRRRRFRSFWIMSGGLGRRRLCRRRLREGALFAFKEQRLVSYKVSRVCQLVYKLSTLTNGLTVATAEMPHMTSVSVGLWVGVGSRYEAVEMNGVCHFIEHLLFKGTKKRSAKQISEAVEGIGGYLNAFTSEEATCFHTRACHDRFDELLDVLMDMALNSKFDPGDIEKEREVIKEEIAMYLDQPHHQVQEVLNSLLWPGQPLGKPITGTGKTLD